MKKIRIGNDISIQWNILRDGKPEKFEGKELSIKLLTYRGEEQIIDYRIEQNIVYVSFLGKNQSKYGSYSLVLIENEGKANMATLDQVEAFNLVEHTFQEGESEGGCTQLKVQSFILDSNFEIKHVVEIIDNLVSTTTNAALSANMGRVLDEKITQVEKKIPLKVSDLPNDANYTNKNYVDEANRVQEGKILAEKQRNDSQDTSISDIIKELDTFVKKVKGYGLSENDFNDFYRAKLDQLNNYNDSELRGLIAALKESLDTLWDGSASEAIDNFREIEEFLKGFTDKESLSNILNELKVEILNTTNEGLSKKVDKTVYEENKKVTDEKIADLGKTALAIDMNQMSGDLVVTFGADNSAFQEGRINETGEIELFFNF